jgi:hypothetical protein
MYSFHIRHVTQLSILDWLKSSKDFAPESQCISVENFSEAFIVVNAAKFHYILSLNEDAVHSQSFGIKEVELSYQLTLAIKKDY